MAETRLRGSGAAESAVHVSSVPPVPGKFYWMTPTQLRWRPLSFWPAQTAVTVDAGGTVVLSNGANTDHTTVLSGGALSEYPGGTGSDTVLSSGAIIALQSGYEAPVLVPNGVTIEIDSDALALGATVL